MELRSFPLYLIFVSGGKKCRGYKFGKTTANSPFIIVGYFAFNHLERSKIRHWNIRDIIFNIGVNFRIAHFQVHLGLNGRQCKNCLASI